jgi:integrase
VAGERNHRGYPFGPLYRLLLLTGARKSEVAGAQWSEFDLDKRVWVVPPERFKSNATHLVPLSDHAMTVLLSVPNFTKGDYLFSKALGERPVGGFGKAKARLDKLMGASSLGYPRYTEDSANQAGFTARS